MLADLPASRALQMITIDQLGGQYSQADADAMNEAARQAIFHFDVETADLSEKERRQIIDEIETTIVANFFGGRLLYEIGDLLPEAFQRLLAARRR